MGKYLEKLKTLGDNVEPLDLDLNFDANVFSEITEVANTQTKSYLGMGLLTTFWFLIFYKLSSPFENFQLSRTQALISTTTIIFTLAIYFIYTGILTNVQHFIWFALFNFVVFILALLKYN